MKVQKPKPDPPGPTPVSFLTLAAIVVIIISPPAEACDAEICGPLEQTQVQTAFAYQGCAWAQSLLYSQLLADMDCEGGYCSNNIVFTTPCYQAPSGA